MFSNVEDNYEMLCGAYKKLKSYYYYNKNFLFMREKIALYEYDPINMDHSLKYLAKVISNPTRYLNRIKDWINSIGYYVLPKTLTEDKAIGDRFITSTLPNKSVTKINYFVDMPIELHLLETIWTLFISKITYDNDIIKECSYGNAIDNKVLFDNSETDLKKSIRFQKNRLFQMYFPQYCAWKNNAINAIDNNKRDKNTVLVSLDVKSFYYSVHWKFDMLSEIIVDSRLDELKGLTRIMKMIYEEYTERISGIRVLYQDMEKKETVLPIGLFSSMLIANIYLSQYDAKIIDKRDVLYYGRYVDDILLLLCVNRSGFTADDAGLDKLLVEDNEVLSKVDSENYSLRGYHDLIIQREKLKVINFECGKCEGMIAQLKKTQLIPSQMNIIPNNDIQMTDFEEAAYAIHNFSSETKIRDLGRLEIDRLKLSSHMAELVRGSKYRTAYTASKEEKIQRQNEKQKVINFFAGSNAIEYCSNWINALYFVLLSSGKKLKDWNLLEEGIRTAIKNVTISHLEDVHKGKVGGTKSKMKKDLLHLFNICIATALAINPKFSKKEKHEIIELCYKIRSANLFNHYLVAYPLMNYSDEMGLDVDLSSITFNMLQREYFDINNSRKMKLSPRFINFDELFHYAFIRSVFFGNNSLLSDDVIENIRNTFYKVNYIDSKWAKPLAIDIVDEENKQEGYILKKIKLYNKRIDLSKVKIAVANIKLDFDSCCMGLNNTAVIRNRFDFISFLRLAYQNAQDKVDYLVFPEFYLPIVWMQDVLSFTRKTGITVICGMQYICRNKIAHNVVCVFARVKSGKYNSSCVIVREKNNYAPLEKMVLATEGYSVVDREKPIYTCFEDGGLRYGLFLCYEFTDICARALFKDQADIIFIPENNHDTTYFSNIIETMTRDIHAFMVQSNTSIYGDSRISGPFSRDQRNIVQIKGGDNDSIITGTIDINEIRMHRIKERNQMEEEIQKIFSMNSGERKKRKEELKGQEQLKVSKVSARTFF